MTKIDLTTISKREHSHFNKENWSKMTVFEQMGNIGSEVGRVFKAMRRGDEDSMRGAFYRGMELIDYTLGLWTKSKNPKTKELQRARELLISSIATDKEEPGLEDYSFNMRLLPGKTGNNEN